MAAVAVRAVTSTRALAVARSAGTGRRDRVRRRLRRVHRRRPLRRYFPTPGSISRSVALVEDQDSVTVWPGIDRRRRSVQRHRRLRGRRSRWRSRRCGRHLLLAACQRTTTKATNPNKSTNFSKRYYVASTASFGLPARACAGTSGTGFYSLEQHSDISSRRAYMAKLSRESYAGNSPIRIQRPPLPRSASLGRPIRRFALSLIS